jgi:hypothetical protein
MWVQQFKKNIAVNSVMILKPKVHSKLICFFSRPYGHLAPMLDAPNDEPTAGCDRGRGRVGGGTLPGRNHYLPGSMPL